MEAGAAASALPCSVCGSLSPCHTSAPSLPELPHPAPPHLTPPHLSSAPGCSSKGLLDDQIPTPPPPSKLFPVSVARTV